MGLAAAAWFLRRIVTKQSPAAQDDPAGMGTEIGLEISLGPVSTDFAGDAAATDKPAPGDDSPMDWLNRRLKRGR